MATTRNILHIIFFIVFLGILFINPLQAQEADFEFSNACFGDVTEFRNISEVGQDTIVQVRWDLNGDLVFNDGTGDTVTFQFGAPGSHNVGMRIVMASGSQKAVYKQVNIGYFPVVDFDFSNTCFGEETEFTNLTSIQEGEVEDFIWDFGDGSSPAYVENPTHFFESIDTYPVTLRAISFQGCSDSVTRFVSIADKPNLILDFSGDTTFYEGDSLVINVIGAYDSILWSNGFYGNTIIIKQSGYYTVTAYLDGCSASRDIPVTVKELPGSGVMNIITPNGDGYNDKWKIFLLEKVGPCSANVFNKWGKEVFSSSSYDNSWQGTYNGSPLQEGTYYYIMKCENGEVLKGPINIIR